MICPVNLLITSNNSQDSEIDKNVENKPRKMKPSIRLHTKKICNNYNWNFIFNSFKNVTDFNILIFLLLLCNYNVSF